MPFDPAIEMMRDNSTLQDLIFPLVKFLDLMLEVIQDFIIQMIIKNL